MPYSGNSWWWVGGGSVQVVLCRRAAIPRLVGLRDREVDQPLFRDSAEIVLNALKPNSKCCRARQPAMKFEHAGTLVSLGGRFLKHSECRLELCWFRRQRLMSCPKSRRKRTKRTSKAMRIEGMSREASDEDSTSRAFSDKNVASLIRIS